MKFFKYNRINFSVDYTTFYYRSYQRSDKRFGYTITVAKLILLKLK